MLNYTNDIEYDEIFKQNVRNQMKIVKKFKENMSIRENNCKKANPNSNVGPSDGDIYIYLCLNYECVV